MLGHPAAAPITAKHAEFAMARPLQIYSGMTPPRCIRPGRTWLVTRRTTRRHFLLRPDQDGTSQAIYWYTTAVIAKKFGIILHAVQVLSTHIHEVLTDPRGVLPLFVRERNRALANALKCHRKWPEEVFQRAPANYVEIFGASATLKEIAYTIANCVEAGLVPSPELWPGARTIVDDIGTRTIEVSRPAMYFDPKNSVWPEKAELRLELPRSLVDAFGSSAKAVLGAYVDRVVVRARTLTRFAGNLGQAIARLTKVPFEKRASSYESFGQRQPYFAAGGDPLQTHRAIVERRAFLDSYRAALERWRAGNSRPAFPEGAWRWARELLGTVT